ncbi:MAG: FHA domain-containing protein [Gammaproteobacteria bacterium]
MRPFIHSLLYPLYALTVLACTDSHAWQELATDIDINCSQSESNLLACSYRLLQAANPSTINARYGEQTLDIITHNIYPTSDAVTAVLLLVDTSDPGRQDVINRNIGQIQQIVSNASAHHEIGLASFDTDLIIHAPPGSADDEIAAAAQTLTAGGLTTELYYNTLRAIQLLARTNADRKVVVLFSDGQAEDIAYFHEDTVNAARSHGVIINSLGFPRSASLSVALQTLRRLSEETGGRFIATGMDFDLPEDFIAAPFANIDKGGQFIIDLSRIDNSIRNPVVEVSFITQPGRVTVNIPVSLPPPPPPALTEVPNQVPVQIQAPAIPAMTTAPDSLDLWLWYGVPTALITLVILSLIALILISRQQPGEDTSGKPDKARPLAYLVSQDESARQYHLTDRNWRIGRDRENDIFINDNSVSRRHAEIRSNKGIFTIYDRNSTNGVFVNNKKIHKHRLKEGDVIEIGDIYLRFTHDPRNYQAMGNVAVLRTRSPAA